MLLFATPLLMVVSLTIGLMVQLFESPSDAVSYSVVVLLYIYAFGYALTWL